MSGGYRGPPPTSLANGSNNKRYVRLRGDEQCHHYLRGKVRYQPFPSEATLVKYTPLCVPGFMPPDRCATFVGQVPNMLPLEAIAWTIDTMAECYVVQWLCQTKKNGCAKLWTRDTEAQRQLIGLSKTVLFDVNGFWWPEDEYQQASLKSYITELQAGRVDADPRVPKCPMVFEELGLPKETSQLTPLLLPVSDRRPPVDRDVVVSALAALPLYAQVVSPKLLDALTRPPPPLRPSAVATSLNAAAPAFMPSTSRRPW